MVIEFGYVTLFVTAFPLAPFLAMLANYMELRIDGWKLLNEFRRPLVVSAENIGSWQTILVIMSALAVITNGAIVLFTTEYIVVKDDLEGWCFMGFQYAVFGLMIFFSFAISDVPLDVEIQLKRQEFWELKLIKKDPNPQIKNKTM